MLESIQQSPFFQWASVIAVFCGVVGFLYLLRDRYFPSNNKAVNRYRKKLERSKASNKKLNKLLDDSKQLIQSVEHILETLTFAAHGDSNMASALRRARVALARGDVEPLKFLGSRQLKRQISNRADAAMLARRYLELSHLEAAQGNFDLAIDNANKASELAPDNPSIWFQLGKLYLRTEQNPDAKRALSRGISLTNNGNAVEPIDLSKAYFRLGTVQRNLGELDQAIKCFKKTLAISTDQGDKDLMAAAYGGIGGIHDSRGQLDQAMVYFKKALVISTDQVDKGNIAEMHRSISLVHYAQGEMDDAQSFSEKALALYTELGNMRGMASASCSLGEMHRAQGEMDDAQSFSETLALYEKLENKMGMATSHRHIGNLMKNTGNTDKAISSWQKAADLYHQLDSPKEMQLRDLINRCKQL